MRKVALVFILSVFVPSLVLAWLAVRSIRDQQFVLERQQSLLHQQVADSLAQQVSDFLGQNLREFSARVEGLLAERSPTEVAQDFDERLRHVWPLAEVAFAVSLEGKMYAPSLFGGTEARKFRLENDLFLCNRESVEVYGNSLKVVSNVNAPDEAAAAPLNQENEPAPQSYVSKSQARNVIPQQGQQQPAQIIGTSQKDQQQKQLSIPQLSKSTPSEAEFRQLVGDAQEGTLARFLQNKLNIMLWYRSPRDWQMIFGAQIKLPILIEGLRPLIHVDPPLADEIAVALLDESARPVTVMPANFTADWKRPFVATEIGESLPHWEIAVYLLNPARLTDAAKTLKLMLGLLVALLLFAIGVGSWLIVADLNRQLVLARQKTDFVSNVSHELKTPLTSIRMFSELLAEGRVTDNAKQQTYLHIISAEAARLTRLINNVLDFARLERGEKKYQFESVDVVHVVRETLSAYRPHLEANGFRLACELPEGPLVANADADAVAQVVVNLVSNAEKYSNGSKEIAASVQRRDGAIEVHVMDRGPGVPAGAEAKIFEQFYRAHESLSHGVAGSGLGLTLARQIARAHHGDVFYRAREGGGSCFVFTLPEATTTDGGSAEPRGASAPESNLQP